ncbi:MAG TPA: molybdenum cofactor guanylyltransferase [Candidatus Binatia bacterium]|nr:molybdenum cofactor guanylyltransferase [Candidatus Binatia bacterium]
MSEVEGVTVFVLAGGRSLRMGSDKSLLSFAGQTLLQRALQTGAAVAERTVIVGSNQLYAAFGEVVEDVYRNCGPLGGIHAALSATRTDLNLVLPVDVPLMSSSFLAWLLRRASAAKELIVVSEALGGLQPLCAVYRREVRGPAEAALQQGDYKISHLFSAVPTWQIPLREIVDAGFSPDMFRNINTQEEYAELLRQQTLGPESAEGEDNANGRAQALYRIPERA